MIRNFFLTLFALGFFSCANVNKKSVPQKLSLFVVQIVTDKTCLYWQLALENVAAKINKKKEITIIKQEFANEIKSDAAQIEYKLVTLCSEQDLLRLNAFLDRLIELVSENNKSKISDTFSIVTKEIDASCKNAWFSLFVDAENIMKNLIYKNLTEISSDALVK